MNSNDLKLGFVLFIIGIIGVGSILTMDIPLPEDVENLLKARFSDKQIKYLLLVNPAIMLLVATIAGTLLYKKVNLRMPVLEAIINKRSVSPELNSILKSGFIAGVIGAIIVGTISFWYMPFMPDELLQLQEKLKPGLAARFLYGGFTEEIIMRFGLMTFVIWLLSSIFNSRGNIIYWIGIIVAALIFGFGHFPIVFQTVSQPSLILLSYILIGNTIGGIIFGWLYWKKGLESAFVAHIAFHIVFILTEFLFN